MHKILNKTSPIVCPQCKQYFKYVHTDDIDEWIGKATSFFSPCPYCNCIVQFVILNNGFDTMVHVYDIQQ